MPEISIKKFALSGILICSMELTKRKKSDMLVDKTENEGCLRNQKFKGGFVMTELQVKTKKGSLKKFFAMFLAVCVCMTTINVNAGLVEDKKEGTPQITLGAETMELEVGGTAKTLTVNAERTDTWTEWIVSGDETAEVTKQDGKYLPVATKDEGKEVVSKSDSEKVSVDYSATVSGAGEVELTKVENGYSVRGTVAGDATITVKAGDKTATCTVTVKPAASSTVSVTGVTLNKNTATLTVGKTEKLSATVAPTNATEKAVTWKSSNDKVATVKDGTVTAVAVGSADITVTTKDGNKTATCKVTVNAAAPSTISVTGVTLDSKATVNVGKTKKLTATVAPANASDRTVTWKSSNTKVATVAADGTVKGVKKGSATITVTTKDGNKTATCKVTVKQPVKSISLTTKSLYVVANKKKDTKLSVGAAIVPTDANVQKISWTSSNKKVTVKADKKSNGTSATITVKKGTKAKTKATITAKADGKTAKITVNVVAKAKKTTSLKLNKKTAKMNTGDKLALTATLSKNSTSTVKWSISGDKKVATVKNGVVTAGKNAGVVTVTAKADKKTAKCVITVTKKGVNVKLQKAKATIKVKKSTTIKIKSPKGDKISKCTSSNKKVATVTNKGKVTGKKAGKADITVVTKKGGVATFKVTVKK